MQIEILKEVPVGPRRHKYSDLVEALARTDQWVQVVMAEVAGSNPATKRQAVHQACAQVPIPVEVRLGTAFIYARRLRDEKVA